MATEDGARKRSRGRIERRGDSLRVRVYAGYDAVTGDRHYLTETIPIGPKAASEAEKIRTRLLSQVDEKRNPKTRRTLNQLLDRYLDVVDVEPRTKQVYTGYVDHHVRPVLGKHQIGRLDGEDFDSLYAQLRRCREHCNGKTKHVKHRTRKDHACDDTCVVVPCSPLSASTVRQIHWILSGAYTRAVRWRWVGTNPLETAQPPAPPVPQPSPPTPAEAARLLAEAWKDPDWGAFVWTAMTTGARRGELCAILRGDVDLKAKVLRVQTGLKTIDGQLQRRDTKTHQQRRIALDDETVAVLSEYVARMDERAAQLDIEIGPDAFLFTLSLDGSEPFIPDTATQRYDRMAKRLGIKTTLHKLRHYSATELLAAGIDIRTIAGRLGHGGGGTTTLKVYAAWVSEADQRAATALSARLIRPRRSVTGSRNS